MFGRAILARDVVQMPDTSVDLDHYTQKGTGSVQRAIIAVPLLRAGAPIGAIAIGRRRTGEIFRSGGGTPADLRGASGDRRRQCRDYRELQERTAALAQRNSEYGERIEQQSATIDVLKVMSASPDDTQPVFDQIVRRAQGTVQRPCRHIVRIRWRLGPPHDPPYSDVSAAHSCLQSHVSYGADATHPSPAGLSSTGRSSRSGTCRPSPSYLQIVRELGHSS